MSDDLKSKLYAGLTTALVSGIMAFAGMEKSESDSTAKSGGKSWIGTNFESHTVRMDGIDRRMDHMSDIELEQQKEIDELRSLLNQAQHDKRNSSGR
jgi:hypothetical protein